MESVTVQKVAEEIKPETESESESEIKKKKKRKKLGMDVEESVQETLKTTKKRQLALEEDAMKEKVSEIEAEVSTTLTLSVEESEITEKKSVEKVDDLAPKVRSPASEEDESEESSSEVTSSVTESSSSEGARKPWEKGDKPKTPEKPQEAAKDAPVDKPMEEPKGEPERIVQEEIKTEERDEPERIVQEEIKTEERVISEEPTGVIVTREEPEEEKPVQDKIKPEKIQPEEIKPVEAKEEKQPEEEKPAEVKPKEIQAEEISPEETKPKEEASEQKEERGEVKQQLEETELQILEEGEVAAVTVKTEQLAQAGLSSFDVQSKMTLSIDESEESSSAFEGDESISEESEKERQKRLKKKKRITTEIEETMKMKGKRRVMFEEEDLGGKEGKNELELTEEERVVNVTKKVDEEGQSESDLSKSESDVSEREKKKKKKKKITTEVEETMKVKGKRRVDFEEEDLTSNKQGTELTLEQEELTLKGKQRIEKVSEQKTELSLEEMTVIKEVTMAKPVLEIVPMPKKVAEGQTIRLECKVKGEGAEVKWYKDDKKLKNKKKPNLRIDYDGTEEVYFLEITNATVEDTGSYTVKAGNAGGSVTTTVAVVVEATIKAVLPNFTDAPKPVKVKEGETIILTSKIEGQPEPVVTWTRNGEAVRATANDSRISIEMDDQEQLFTLEISNAKSTDSGSYTINASNSEGTVSKVVEVNVLSAVEEEIIDEEKAPEATSAPAGVAPEIGEKPKNVTATETETIKISITITGTPSPTVSWLKNKKPMIVKEKIEIFNEVDIYFLVIKDSATSDSGEYTIQAENAFGSTSANFTINVEAAAEEDDSSIMDRIAEKVAAEKEKITEEDKEMLFKEYPLLGDHSDKTHSVTLKKDDVVQVMDTAKEDEWLCRKKDQPDKVCYVPVELLLGGKPKDEEDSGEESKPSEEVYPLYVCILDYSPSEEDHLAVVEGQTVEVLDSSNPDLWLCRTLPDELGDRKQGWMPPSYLVNKKDAKGMSTREAFREDIIKVDNKQQEAQMKRRYALNDLWESERDYIRDLKFSLDTYYVMFDGELPEELVGKKEHVFANYKEIHGFHDQKFLDALCTCTQKPNSVGQVFLDHMEDFQLYVDYYLEREVVDKMLQEESLAKFIKEYDEEIKNVGESKHSLREYLARPFKRIDEYVMILQDILRYSAQVGDETDVLQRAIQMLMDLRRKAEQKLCMENIIGYPGDLAALGPIIRHEDFLVWEGAVTGKGKERHLFLYKDRLLITKKKKSKIPGGRPTFEFITEILVPEVWLHEFLPEERRFALSYQDKTRETFTLQAKTVPIKVAWCDELRRLGFAPAIESEAPEFIGKLKDTLCTEGETVRLECQISGKPFPELKWFHNGDLINPSSDLRIENDNDRYFLVMPRVSPAYSGTFTVKATNKAGTQESSAELIVEPEAKEPKFVNTLRDTEVRVGEDARFECKITAHPAPDVKWYKGDDKISESDKYKIIIEDIRYILIVKNISEADVGKYKIKVKNKLGSESSKAKLSLTEEPKKPGVKPNISDRFTDLELIKGEKAEFVCKLQGEPAPEVTWYHNNLALVETERIKILQTENTYTLIITKVLTIDTGEVKLVATNEEGEASCSAKLFVTDDTIIETTKPSETAPTFTKKMSDKEVPVGNAVEFRIKFHGDPKPKITWYYEEKEIIESEKYTFEKRETSFKLRIESCSKEDYGKYSVTLKNELGEVTSSATLSEMTITKEPVDEGYQAPIMPLDKPYITNMGDNYFCMNWLPAIFPLGAKPCKIRYVIERRDLPSSQWNRMHDWIADTNFLIENFDPGRDYMYRVRAETDHGESDPTNSLPMYAKTFRRRRRSMSRDKTRTPSLEPKKERLPPKTPRDKPLIYDVTDDSLCLSWQASEIPSFAEQTEIFYIVERRCPPKKEWIEIASDLKDTKFFMPNYKQEKDYMFRIRASNKYGTSDPSTSESILAKPIEEPKVKKEIEEHLPKVKPRTIWDKPELHDITDTSVTLKWKESSCPNYAAQIPIWYIVEQREPPDPTWVKLATNLETPELAVTKGFSRKKDFYWRVRAVNEIGQSEPSMPAMLRRIDEWELEMKEPKKQKREKSVDDKASTRAVPAHLRIIPEFLSTIEDTQYGVETLTAKVVTRIRGYPEPKIMWYFKSEKLTLGDKYRISLSSMGDLTLEVTHFTWNDVGPYKIYMENDFGNAIVNYNMEMADPPTFLEPMHDKVFNLRKDGKLECRVIGIPYPKVTFKHDWRVIADSHRIKIAREDFDHWTVNYRNVIYQDEGMYECVAENIAGKVYCVANIKITEKIGLGRDVKFNRVPVEEYFHLIDEIGRGSCGIVRRVIDKNSGNQYAVKLLNYADELTKDELVTELEMMALLDHHNLVQIIDGYENKKCLAIVMEIVTGGELIPRLLKEDCFTESEAAYYIRQLLLGLEYMHAQSVMHLDVKPENIFLSSPLSDEVKLIDFGNARRYIPTRNTKSKYGTPEFIAPEVARELAVTPATDMWSVGVISYLLLSGISPFHCPTPRETLERVKKGDWSFDEETFANVSEESKDFIKKLINPDPKKRMSASEALEHKFVALSYHRGLGDRIALDRLRGYVFRRKAERGINCVKGHVQLRPLSNYLSGETKTIGGLGLGLGGPEIEVCVPILNLPGELGPLSCTGSTGSQLELGAAGMLQIMGPSSAVSEMGSVAGSGGSSEWGREYEDEDTWYEFSSSYQAGAETQLIPSIDIGLTTRLAQYRRTTGTKGATPRQRPGRRDRRELRDMGSIDEDGMDIAAATAPSRGKRKVWQLKSLADAIGMEQGFPPIFKEKIRDKAYSVGDSCTITVRVQGNPPPAVSWYRNEELLTEGGRVRTTKSYEDSKYSLTLLSTKPHDFGVFKCVARNKYGKVTCRGRMLLGDQPGRPGRPHVTKVSATEAFMVWEEPESDGNSTITAYRVDWLKPGDERWTTATYCIDECALIKGLKSETSYRFRVTAINKFGLSPFSFGSVEVRTKKKGSASIDIDSETKKILLRSRQATNKPSPDPSPSSSRRGSLDEEADLSEVTDKKKRDYYEFMDREIHLQEIDPAKFLTFGSEVWRGRFTLIRNVKPIKGKAKQVAKIIPYDSRKAEESLREYEMLKNVRQEHIIRMFEAYHHNDFVILVLEKLYGENVARSLSLKNRYNEHQVVTILKQVLDALQFLHHRGIVHLNLQPDNVIMVSRRRLDIKLTDFGRARRITSYDGEKVPREGTAEFMAPEKVNNDKVGVPADIWGVGLLAFILLSGVSPFRGDGDDDTMQNIKQVRYDAHQIFHNVTKYALKFIYLTLRKSTLSRLTTEECLEHKWMMLNAPLIKSKKAAIFSSDRLRYFEEEYIRSRLSGYRPNDKLIKSYGTSDGAFSSDEEDIFPKSDD